MGDMRALGRFIRARREVLGLSQREFARRIGKEPSWISSLELGRVGAYLPDPESLRRIADVLRVSTHELLAVVGYLDAAGDEADAYSPETRLFLSAVAGVEWEQVPATVREMVLRDLRYARELAERQQAAADTVDNGQS